MTKEKESGGPAFPSPARNTSTTYTENQNGMSLRQWYAGKIMAGFAADPKAPENENGLADLAVCWADALIAAEKK